MTSKPSSDGRVQRSERSRQVIVDAMLYLINQGNLAPTAQQVADEAGVAIRTVFRHFSEMEQLYAEIDASIQPAYMKLFQEGDREGSLEQRITRAAEHHGHAYSIMSPVMQSAKAMLWRSPIISSNYAKNQRRLRGDLEDWLPELKALPVDAREAIDAISSFEFWDRLRSQQGLSKKASIDLVAKLLLQQME